MHNASRRFIISVLNRMVFQSASASSSQVKSSKPLFKDLVDQRNLDIAHSEKELAKLILQSKITTKVLQHVTFLAINKRQTCIQLLVDHTELKYTQK